MGVRGVRAVLGTRRLVAVLVVVALTAAGGVVATRRAAAVPGAAPAASDPRLDGRPDDGLNRLVVRVETEQADATGDPEPAPAADDTAAEAPAGPDPVAARDALVDALDADGLQPRPRESLAPGTERDVERPAPPPKPVPTAELTSQVVTVAGDPSSVPLADVPGIVDTMRIDDERVAVVTSLRPDTVAGLPGVVEVAEDVLGELYSVDPHYGALWGLHNTGQIINGVPGVVGADVRWEDARPAGNGAGVVVAVIDSGVQTNHPDLANLWWRNADEVCGNGADDDANGYVDDCDGWDFANNDRTVFDSGADNNHGTHVTGTIAANVDNNVGVAGVAPGVRIMPLKVMHNGTFPMSRVSAAIHYAVENGADVINASIGTTVSGAQPPDLAVAIEAARAAGVLVVAAAGNNTLNLEAESRWPASSTAPNVITVGASTNTDGVAGYSNYGATTVDVFAPGSLIYSTVPGSSYGWMSGTSMAAPHVSGVAALALQARGLRGDALRGALMATAVPVAAYGGKAVTGARVNAAAVVEGGGDGAAVELYDFDGFQPGVAHTGSVRVRVPDAAAFDGVDDPALRATLGYVHEGTVHGVLGQAITVGVDGTTSSLTTDTDAQVWLTPAALVDGVRRLTVEGVTATVRTALPTGRYALLVEVVDRDDPSEAIVAAAGGFTVGDPDAEPEPDPGPPSPGTSPNPGTAPAPGTSPDPGTSPAPGTSPSPGTSPDPGTPPAPGTSPGPGTSPAPGTSPDPGTSPAPGTSPSPGTSPDPGTSPAPGTSPSPGTSPGPGTSPAPGTSPSPGTTPPTSTPPSATYLVSPGSGLTGGGTTVTVTGEMPASARVTFGGSNGAVTYADGNRVMVTTPAHPAGKVDVVVSGTGGTVTLPGAFTYVDPDGNGPAPETPGETEEPAGPDPRTVGEPFDAPNGLRIDAFLPGHPLLRAQASVWLDGGCTSPVCSAVMV